MKIYANMHIRLVHNPLDLERNSRKVDYQANCQKIAGVVKSMTLLCSALCDKPSDKLYPKTDSYINYVGNLNGEILFSLVSYSYCFQTDQKQNVILY